MHTICCDRTPVYDNKEKLPGKHAKSCQIELPEMERKEWLMKAVVLVDSSNKQTIHHKNASQKQGHRLPAQGMQVIMNADAAQRICKTYRLTAIFKSECI